MQWNHLPVTGGLYEQDPQLLEDFRYILSRKSRYEKEKMDREKAEAKNPKKTRTRGGRR